MLTSDLLRRRATDHYETGTSRGAADQDVSQPEPWLASGQIPLLNGFRAIAVLLVLAAHACQTSGFPVLGGHSAILKQGAIGVDLFFVVSGFLITTLLIREHRRDGRVSLKGFFTRRCLRILPAYCCFLSAVFLLQSLGFVSLSLRDWGGALTHTMNFVESPGWELGHAWSLSIEEHFYLLWPLAFVALGPTRCGAAAGSCIVIGFVIRVGLLTWRPDDAWMAGRWTFTRMDAIAIGCLLAIAVRMPRHREWINRVCQVRCMPGLAVCGLIVSIVLGEQSYRYRVALGYPVEGLLLAVLLWSTLLRYEQPRFQLLDTRWLQAIGMRSYSIYLWQQLFLNPGSHSVFAAHPWNLICAIIAGCLSYRLIEVPVLSLRHRLSGLQAASIPPALLPDERHQSAEPSGPETVDRPAPALAAT